MCSVRVYCGRLCLLLGLATHTADNALIQAERCANEMLSYSQISEALTEALRLLQRPVAVCLSETVPSGVEHWTGHSPAGCLFWQKAGKCVFATSARDHALCSIGLYTHNLEMGPRAAVISCT